MFDIVEIDKHTDRDLLVHFIKVMRTMAIDLSKLQAAVTRNTAAIEALIAAHNDPAAQAAVDAAAAALDVESAKAEAAVAPPPAP